MTGLSRRAGREGPLEISASPRSGDECIDVRDPMRGAAHPAAPMSGAGELDYDGCVSGNFPEMLFTATKSLGMSMIFRGQGFS